MLASTKDKHLEFKFYDRNQVDDKIALGLGGGILSIHSSFFIMLILYPFSLDR
jgi:hypothetical protein